MREAGTTGVYELRSCTQQPLLSTYCVMPGHVLGLQEHRDQDLTQSVLPWSTYRKLRGKLHLRELISLNWLLAP